VQSTDKSVRATRLGLNFKIEPPGNRSPPISLLFSSHLSRAAVTDLSANRCENGPTFHHAELLPSPEPEQSFALNHRFRSLKTCKIRIPKQALLIVKSH
jgi:hypothetical protein